MFNVGDTKYTIKFIHQLELQNEVDFFNKDDAIQYHEYMLRDPLCYGSTVIEQTVIGRHMKKTID